jgi:hypothetical protein
VALDPKWLTLAYAVNAAAPLILLADRERALDSLLTLVLAFPLVLTLYYLLKRSWTPLGLYAYVREVSPSLALVQLASWISSYFLYLSYTVDDVVYDVLSLRGFRGALAFLVLTALITVSLFRDWAYWALLGLAPIQVILSLPLGPLSPLGGFTNLEFLDILSSSLLVVCLTLIPYSRSARPWYVFAAFLTSALGLLSGSLFSPPEFAIRAQWIGMIALVVAEFVAIKTLLVRGFGVPKYFRVTVILYWITSLMSLLNPTEYYDLTIAPSVILLYLTLGIAFSTSAILFRGWRSLFSAASAALMGYGLFNAFALASPLQIGIGAAALIGCAAAPLIFRGGEKRGAVEGSRGSGPPSGGSGSP